MTFTGMAANLHNVIRFIKTPVKVVCIQVWKVYSRCRHRGAVTLCWNYGAAAQKPTPFPPLKLLSCRLTEARIIESRLLHLKLINKVFVKIRYLVQVEAVYRDCAGNIGVAVMREELARRSGPLPGTPAMSGAADLSLDLLQCRLDCTRQSGVEQYLPFDQSLKGISGVWEESRKKAPAGGP